MEEKTYIYEGKTSTEALEKGLKELKLKKSDIDYRIIENEEKRSFFSILTPRIVKVEIKIKKDNNIIDKKNEINKETKVLSENELMQGKENLKKFLDAFINTLPDENIKYEISDNKGFIKVNLLGDNLNYLIGYRGDVLNSLQTLYTAVASKGINRRIKVVVDILGYREKRDKTLQNLADKLAKKVIRDRKKMILEPMTAYERKIIHERLQNHPKVQTSSIGEEPNRKIVISLKY